MSLMLGLFTVPVEVGVCERAALPHALTSPGFVYLPACLPP